jgi:hypothetical protein
MNIRDKIRKDKIIMTKADKEKTLIILTEEEYKQQVRNFIRDFIPITQHYQKTIKQTLK